MIQSQNNPVHLNLNVLDFDYSSDDDNDGFTTNHKYQNEEDMDTKHRYTDQDLNDSIILGEFKHSQIIQPEDETTYQEADLLNNNFGTNNYNDNLFNLSNDSLQHEIENALDTSDSASNNIYDLGLFISRYLTRMNARENNQI